MNSERQNFDYSDIRPYRDEEVPAVVSRVLGNKNFEKLVKFIYPETPVEQIFRMMRSCKSVYDFQKNISRTAVKAVLKRSADELTWSGFEHISKEKGQLFISNHRDIVLDSAILNITLIDERLKSTETAIGSNLLTSQLAHDLSKLNKNFVVKRNISKKELYDSSLKLSHYIHHTICDQSNSVWLAQKEGRTKDGLDLTQPGVLKMLTIGFDGAYADCFQSLNILPMSISYEYDPCDFLKANEIHQLRLYNKYEKSRNEDLQSMITGAMGYKGRIHLQIGTTIHEDIEVLREEQNKNEKIHMLSKIIDQKIHHGYKLWPSNYVAHDLMYVCGQMEEHYTPKDRERFEEYLTGQMAKIENAQPEHRNILLQMYANPVLNFERYIALKKN